MAGTSMRMEAQAEQAKPPMIDGLVGMLNIFIDPATTARKLRADYAWLWPVATIVVLMVVFGLLMVPYTQQLIDARLAQAGSAQNAEQARNMARIATTIGLVSTPIIAMGMMALTAWLISGIINVFGSQIRFRDTFTMVACAGLIPLLQYVAGYLVIRAKGDPVETIEQMRPPFGLDLFLPNLKGVALAFIGFFSIFQIWHVIVLTIGVACLVRCSKGKAFAAITPAWAIPLLLTIVGAAFQK